MIISNSKVIKKVKVKKPKNQVDSKQDENKVIEQKIQQKENQKQLTRNTQLHDEQNHHVTQEELRKTIIWAEILGAPVCKTRKNRSQRRR